MSHNISPEALDTVLDVVLQNMRSGKRKLSQTPENPAPFHSALDIHLLRKGAVMDSRAVMSS